MEDIIAEGRDIYKMVAEMSEEKKKYLEIFVRGFDFDRFLSQKNTSKLAAETPQNLKRG